MNVSFPKSCIPFKIWEKNEGAKSVTVNMILLYYLFNFNMHQFLQICFIISFYDLGHKYWRKWAQNGNFRWQQKWGCWKRIKIEIN